MRRIDATGLPPDPLSAAAQFHADIAPLVAGGDAAIIFAPAPHGHSWRLAAVQDLARAAAPARVNGIVGQGEAAIAATLAFLAAAPGVTGQLLVLAGNPAESD